MKRLRYSILAVVVALTFLFNIERIDLDDASVVNLSSFVYVLGFLVVVSAVLFRVPRANGGWSGAIAVLWAVAYLASKAFVFRGRPLWGGVHSYVTMTELAIILALSLLSSRLVSGLREFERAVATLTLTETSREVRSVQQAGREIQDRVLLSRRHQRPLSVLVFGVDRAASAVALHGIVEDVLRGMANHYAVATLANAIVRSVRRTDLPLQQGRDGRFVVLCPETDGAGAEMAARNVQRAVMSELGVELDFGVAAFPGDALTFEELLRHAEGQLNVRQAPQSLAVSSESQLARE